jgi:hypothetical protein
MCSGKYCQRFYWTFITLSDVRYYRRKYHWMYRKSLIGGVQGFKPMCTTGPHKIYLSYNFPQLDTVNELGLKYICNYARNLNDSLMIFRAGIEGIYEQHWKYDPNHNIFYNPLDMLRVDTPIGQCVDYANLAVYYSSSIGLNANTALVFNGRNDPPLIDHYSFLYSKDLPSYHYYNLYSTELKSIQGDKDNWMFIYHAVSRLGGHLGDPVFNIVEKETEYAKWWRYYLHPYPDHQPFSYDEPPPFPPYYYNYRIFAIPDSTHTLREPEVHMTNYRFPYPRRP